MLSFSLNQVAWAGDRLARSITSVSTFNIRFTAFFIAVPATRDHPVEVLVEPLIPSCSLFVPQYRSRRGKVGFIASNSISVPPNLLPATPRHFSFPYFRALSFSRLAINDHRSADQVDVMTTRTVHTRNIRNRFSGDLKGFCLKSDSNENLKRYSLMDKTIKQLKPFF